MKDLQKKIGSSFAQGKFKDPKNQGEDSKSIFFTPMENMTDPEVKDAHPDDSVTFSTSGSSGNFSNGNGRIDRPSLQRPQNKEDSILFNNIESETRFIGPLEQEQTGP